MATVSKSFSHLAKLVVLTALLITSGCGRGHKFWTNWWTPGDTVDNVGYHPEQPIEFPHNLHVKNRQISCEYCHSAARRSASAGIPPMNTCMGCHQYVRTDKEPIKFLKAKWDAKEAIAWTKVHDLPDFVRFSHRPHIQFQSKDNPEFKNGIPCQQCHGDVENMTTVYQAKSLQMGWCVECHQANKAPIACVTCHY